MPIRWPNICAAHTHRQAHTYTHGLNRSSCGSMHLADPGEVPVKLCHKLCRRQPNAIPHYASIRLHCPTMPRCIAFYLFSPLSLSTHNWRSQSALLWTSPSLSRILCANSTHLTNGAASACRFYSISVPFRRRRRQRSRYAAHRSRYSAPCRSLSPLAAPFCSFFAIATQKLKFMSPPALTALRAASAAHLHSFPLNLAAFALTFRMYFSFFSYPF